MFVIGNIVSDDDVVEKKVKIAFLFIELPWKKKKNFVSKSEMRLTCFINVTEGRRLPGHQKWEVKKADIEYYRYIVVVVVVVVDVVIVVVVTAVIAVIINVFVTVAVAVDIIIIVVVIVNVVAAAVLLLLLFVVAAAVVTSY